MYCKLTETTVQCISSSEDQKIRSALLDSIRTIGGSTIRLVESMRLASAKSAADQSSRLKLGQAGRDVSSNISNLILVVKDGSKGIATCQESITNINSVISEIETTLIFAQAGNLDPIYNQDTFSKHKDGILSSSKSLSDTVKKFVASISSGSASQEELANCVTILVKSVDAVKNYVRDGAVSITSGDKHMQLQLLNASKAVAENLQKVISTAITSLSSSSSGADSDAISKKLGETVKLEFSSIAELVQITKVLEDESSRGIRALVSILMNFFCLVIFC
jgi:talin